MSKKDNLETSHYFHTPIYHIEIPEWINSVNKVCNKYIKNAKKRNQPAIKQREKRCKKKIGDLNMSHHSSSMVNDPLLKEFQSFIGATSHNILENMGYDLSNYSLFWTELWVQEFSKQSGGHHIGHIHYDNHISGFYFLKCSDKTSVPYFNDPRIAKTMNDLPLKSSKEISLATPLIHYKPKPGTMVFFPAYINHGFTVDDGVDDFRFIHFNLQAVRKVITDAVKK